MPPPNIFGLKPISLTARTMPTEFGRIGADDDDVGIGRLDGAHDRREVGRRRRIALVVDDLEAGRLGVLARAVGGVAREFLVGGDDRDGLRLRVLRHRDVEEALGEGGLRVRPRRDHREIVRVVELGVHREPEQADEDLLAAASRSASPAPAWRWRRRRRRGRPCRRRAASCRCPAPSTGCSGRRSRRASPAGRAARPWR